MPFAALKPCAYPGCITLVKTGFCDEHRRAEIDYHDPASKRLYNSARWQMIRRLQLATHPWCEECLHTNIYEQAVDVHHVEPHGGDPKKFFMGKLESLCKPCHTKKKAEEIKGRGA